MTKKIILTGESLTCELLYEIGYNYSNVVVALSEEALKKVDAARQVIDKLQESGVVKYGISTGFGLFSNVRIDTKDIDKLQVNLIRSQFVFCHSYDDFRTSLFKKKKH